MGRVLLDSYIGKELMLREVRAFAQGHTAASSRAGMGPQVA